MTANEKLLRNIIKRKALVQGSFGLSSGMATDYYFDCRMISMSHTASLIGDVICDRISDLRLDGIGGPQAGAIPIVTAVAISYGRRGRRIEGFWTRTGIKGYGTEKLIEGNVRVGNKVAIVDDVATSGHSLLKAVEAARSAHLDVVTAVVLVDRLKGAEALLKGQGVTDYRPILTLKDFGK